MTNNIDKYRAEILVDRLTDGQEFILKKWKITGPEWHDIKRRWVKEGIVVHNLLHLSSRLSREQAQRYVELNFAIPKAKKPKKKAKTKAATIPRTNSLNSHPVAAVATNKLKQSERLSRHKEAWRAGQEYGKKQGHKDGYQEGLKQGRTENFHEGVQEGEIPGRKEGYERGHKEGWKSCLQQEAIKRKQEAIKSLRHLEAVKVKVYNDGILHVMRRIEESLAGVAGYADKATWAKKGTIPAWWIKVIMSLAYREEAGGEKKDEG